VIEVLVVLGGFLGGLASGLTGFGFGLSSLPLWAFVLAPSVSAPIVVVCSLVGQVQTMPAIWHSIDLRRLTPFVLLGLLGVPLGVWLLPQISPATFRVGFGLILIVTCSLLLVLQVERRRDSTRAGDALVGFAGGILGGITGLSGVLLTIWAELHGWGKDERRAIFQGFNFSILVFALATLGVSGLLDAQLLPILLLAVPGTIVGAYIGRKLYARIDAKRFNRTVLVLLLIAGAVLVLSPALTNATGRGRVEPSRFHSLGAGADQHLARTDESLRRIELPQRGLDLAPRFGALGLAQRSHHLVQGPEGLAFEAHALRGR